MIDLLIKNKEWILSGIGVFVLNMLFLVYKKDRPNTKQKAGSQSIMINGDVSGGVNLNVEDGKKYKKKTIKFTIFGIPIILIEIFIGVYLITLFNNNIITLFNNNNKKEVDYCSKKIDQPIIINLFSAKKLNLIRKMSKMSNKLYIKLYFLKSVKNKNFEKINSKENIFNDDDVMKVLKIMLSPNEIYKKEILISREIKYIAVVSEYIIKPNYEVIDITNAFFEGIDKTIDIDIYFGPFGIEQVEVGRINTDIW